MVFCLLFVFVCLFFALHGDSSMDCGVTQCKAVMIPLYEPSRKIFVMTKIRPRVCTRQIIHPASRGVAAHTAGLFRSVRGAKGGFPPWGLPKLRIFTFPPRGGSPS